MSALDTAKQVYEFAAPLISEAISLGIRWISASKLEQAQLEARKQAAILEMKGAQQTEKQAHAERTAETLRLIEEAERGNAGERGSQGEDTDPGTPAALAAKVERP
jgi:hypothetical protein